VVSAARIDCTSKEKCRGPGPSYPERYAAASELHHTIAELQHTVIRLRLTVIARPASVRELHKAGVEHHPTDR
jgi:hypothetical protein